MSKSVLVIETPGCCIECQMRFRSGEISIGKFEYRKLYSCKRTPYEIGVCYFPDILHSGPDWCPLLDFPGKKSENKYHNERERGMVDGFNACIGEILKGANVNE